MSPELLSQTEKLGRLEADQYRRETGFPTRTSEVIRDHLQQVFTLAVHYSGIRISYIGCDHLCSVGLGGNRAIPGSDVDGLSIVYIPPVNEKELREFRKTVMQLINQQLVNLSPYDLHDLHLLPITWLEHVATFKADNLPDTITSKTMLVYCYQQVAHGTCLYEEPLDILDRLRKSPFAQSVLSPQSISTDDLPERRIIKYETRKTLKNRFLLMTPLQQYTVIRVMMHLRHEDSSDPVDFSVGGKDHEVLDSLLKLSLFDINDGVFQPLWVHGTGLRC